MTTTINFLELVSCCCDVSVKAAQIIRSIVHHGVDRQTIDKAENPEHTNISDPQTIADRAAQQLIVGSLQSKWKELKIVGEEGELERNTELEIQPSTLLLSSLDLPSDMDYPIEDLAIWVDPLDGTQMFLQEKYERVSILIGITYQQRPIAGIIQQPFALSCPDTSYTTFGILNTGVFRTHHIHDAQDLVSESLVKWTQVQRPSAHGMEATTRITTSEKPYYPRDLVAMTFSQAQVTPNGATGNMLLSLLLGEQDLYLRLRKGTKRWDICACEAILLALGGTLVDKYGQVYHYDPTQEAHDNVNGIVASFSTSLQTQATETIRDIEILRNPDGKFDQTWIEESLLGATGQSLDNARITCTNVFRGRHSCSAQINIIHKDGRGSSYFLKRAVAAELPSRSPAKWIRDLQSYRNETSFYKYLYPELKKCGVALPCPFYIYQTPAEDEMMNQKDLVLLPNFRIGYTQHACLNFEQAKMALDYLAKFHAIGWQNPTTILKSAKRYCWPHGGWWDYQKRGREELLNARDIWDKFQENWRDAFPPEFFKKEGMADLGQLMIDHAEQIHHELTGDHIQPYETLIHGDYKTANLFYSDDMDHMLAIDMQWSGVGLGALDVAYFIQTSVDFATLDSSEAHLMQYYHSQFQDYCQTACPYAYADFERHYALSVLDYGRVALSYFWEKFTRSTCEANREKFNKGLVYRSEAHARRFVTRLRALLRQVFEC